MKSERIETFLLGLKNARGINLPLRIYNTVTSLLLKMMLLKRSNTFIRETLKFWRVLTRLRIRDNIVMKGDVDMKFNLCSKGHKAKYVVFYDAPCGVCAVFFSSKKAAEDYMYGYRDIYSLHDVSGRLL